MAEARSREAWNHTAAVMALIANCNRDPKKRGKPFEMTDFHPCHAAKKSDKVLRLGKKESFAAFKSAFFN